MVERVLRNNGFQVVPSSARPADWTSPGRGAGGGKLQPGQFEAMCNPIAQAELLNSQDTQFNICLGLCVGPRLPLLSILQSTGHHPGGKDRVLAHNPVGAIHYADTYFKGSAQGLTPGAERYGKNAWGGGRQGRLSPQAFYHTGNSLSLPCAPLLIYRSYMFSWHMLFPLTFPPAVLQ